MDTLNVVVTCTKDKRFSISNNCEMRSLPIGNLDDRITQWQQRLSESQIPPVAVNSLYSGDHWATVRSFASNVCHLNVWVCSAGYGLIHISDQIIPYAATFSANHPDSILRGVIPVPPTGNSDWWNLLSEWRPTGIQGPRSLADLGRERPGEAFLVVASKTYMKAICDDLIELRNRLDSHEQLTLLSAGTKRLNRSLDGHLIPCDGRLQSKVGGALRSVNTRTAKYIISTAKAIPRLTPLKQRMTKLLASLADMPTYDRDAQSDQQVKSFIFGQLAFDPNLKHTPLLRKLRNQGFACEQKRFAAIYYEVKEEIHDNS